MKEDFTAETQSAQRLEIEFSPRTPRLCGEKGAPMTFEEAFDYMRSLSSFGEEKIREVLTEHSKPGSDHILKDEDSNTSFQIRYTEQDGYIIDALFS